MRITKIDAKNELYTDKKIRVAAYARVSTSEEAQLISLEVQKVYFEKENINTLSMESELLLSILSSYAADESRSISENNKWSIRKRFESGEYKILTPPYGYDVIDGKLIINDEEGKVVPSYMWNQNGWLCDKLGLTIKSQTQVCIPVTHKEDLESLTLGLTIKSGDATGMESIVTTETEEGITLETHNLGYVYGPEDFDKNTWTFEGEPTTIVMVDEPDTVRLTCSNLVNRIPALIDAEPGYVTTDKLPNPRFMVKDMNYYINKGDK